MSLRSTDIQDAAGQALENIKACLNPAAKDAYATGYKTVKKLRKAYPEFSDKISDTAYRTFKQSKQALQTAGSQMSHTADGFGRQIRGLESSVLKIGFIYVVYRLFVTDDHIVNASRKVKAHIEEKPIESAIMALGAGYILGKMIRW